MAFRVIDMNRSGAITCGLTVPFLEKIGIPRQLASSLWRRLNQLVRCERRGCMTLDEWLAAWAQAKVLQELRTLTVPGGDTVLEEWLSIRSGKKVLEDLKALALPVVDSEPLE